MATPPPLKETTLKKYMKASTGLRVDADAVDWLAEQVNAQIKRIVRRAAVLAEMEERSTLLLRDAQRAMEETHDSTDAGSSKVSPEIAFDAIEAYGIDELSDLARRIEASLNDD